MRRLWLSFIVALLTFTIGSVLAIKEMPKVKWAGYQTNLSSAQEFDLTRTRLEAVDKYYSAKCWMPHGFDEGRYIQCYDEWATARRIILLGE